MLSASLARLVLGFVFASRQSRRKISYPHSPRRILIKLYKRQLKLNKLINQIINWYGNKHGQPNHVAENLTASRYIYRIEGALLAGWTGTGHSFKCVIRRERKKNTKTTGWHSINPTDCAKKWANVLFFTTSESIIFFGSWTLLLFHHHPAQLVPISYRVNKIFGTCAHHINIEAIASTRMPPFWLICFQVRSDHVSKIEKGCREAETNAAAVSRLYNLWFRGDQIIYQRPTGVNCQEQEPRSVSATVSIQHVSLLISTHSLSLARAVCLLTFTIIVYAC